MTANVIPVLTKAWNVLGIRILVSVSLLLQIVLLSRGNRRRYITSRLTQFFIWFNYLSADSVANFALGILFSDNKNPSLHPNFIFMANWAPFLLLNLGGPDTITSYSLEDNELWLRHLLVSIYHLVAIVFVVFKSWNGSHLNYVAIPVLVAGIIKYGERTWSLRLASRKKFRESSLPDLGSDYVEFLNNYSIRQAEGNIIFVGEVIETTPTVLDHSQRAIANSCIPEASFLHDGFHFFKIFKCLFVDLILSFEDHKNNQVFF
ncbi:uncharacterized protein LOC133306024 [Gastrolobium bilobum]|uniref:uncharacterized protein LOC133306024 n=1 Tax=Gastrolobium bilobum TaxID=150636 RepID=UPI002AB10EC3|nr:uncharacterized protein LOC133306024 [Gastrolobium bilobum]